MVNAAGVWAQRLAPGIRLVPSRGSHLVLRADRLGSPSAALTVPLPGSRSRYVFALPQADGLVYLGITDEPVEGPVPDDDPQPSDAEVQQLLDTVNQVLAEPLTREDLVGAYAGYRPLVLPESAGSGPGDATADLSRKHLLSWDGPVLSVVGGKLTTYRAMAEETVDAVVARLGGTARSTTARLPLVGAAPRPVLDALDRARRGWSPATAPTRRRWRRSAPTSWWPGGRRRWASCGSPSGTRVRAASRTCWTGAPASGWCPPTVPARCRWPSRCWPRRPEPRPTVRERGSAGWDDGVGLPAWTRTRTGTPSPSCSRTAGARPRTPRPTCCPLLRPGMDLLDVGCGPGTLTADLAARVAPGRVLGLDVSADPLDEARAAAERAGAPVTFAVGDVYALDLPDDSFDVVHAHQVLQHLTDPVAALREMARVCRPGGVVAVRDVDYATVTWFPANPGLDRWLALYSARRPRQRRRARRRPPAGRVGARRRAAGPHRDGVVLVLRLAAGAGVVGQLVGRPRDGVVLRRAGGRLRAGDAGRAGRSSPTRGAPGGTPTTAGSG